MSTQTLSLPAAGLSITFQREWFDAEGGAGDIGYTVKPIPEQLGTVEYSLTGSGISKGVQFAPWRYELSWSLNLPSATAELLQAMVQEQKRRKALHLPFHFLLVDRREPLSELQRTRAKAGPSLTAGGMISYFPLYKFEVLTFERDYFFTTYDKVVMSGKELELSIPITEDIA